MDQSVRDVIETVTRASDEERITFPEVVGALMAAGVERYHADMTRSERIFYMPDGGTQSVASHIAPGAAADFSASAVAAAVRAIQRQEIRYREFCRRIAAAGCAGYHVFLRGRRAVYYGRTGDGHN